MLRLEPLLVRAYKTVAPLVLHPYNAGGKVPYDQMPLEPVQTDNILRKMTGELSEKEESAQESINSIPSPPTPSRGKILSILERKILFIFIQTAGTCGI
jgi:hypothetical protein